MNDDVCVPGAGEDEVVPDEDVVDVLAVLADSVDLRYLSQPNILSPVL